MTGRLSLYAQKATRYSSAIAELEDTALTTVLDGVSYARADLVRLYEDRDWFMLKAAIEMIEGGLQSYTLLGRTFTRGDLQVLYEREKELRRRRARRAMGGSRTREIVPLA
ncbi:MAG: hypothetical protein HOP28_15915 [Gemmatimonadales bacterium]|nr:hypothetical protein [Gemmatimonadales bacterium]